MHAPMAYLNGTGNTRSRRREGAGLEILNALLSSATNRTPIDRGQNEPHSKKDPRSENSCHPDGFKNDPDDPANPNEARNRFHKKVDKQHNR
jgi:hypothetical protein